MEKAIIINRKDDLRHCNSRFKRVYLGNEFCSRLLPCRKEAEDIMKEVVSKKIEVTLLTPQVGEEEIGKVKELAGIFHEKGRLKEIVVNDYGVFNYIKMEYPDCAIIFGRIISKALFSYPGDFLRAGVKGFETDDFFVASKAVKNLAGKHPGLSYYYPYTLVYNSLYCPMANIKNNRSKNAGITECSKECQEIGELLIKRGGNKKDTILKGNSQFFKNNNFKKIKNGLIGRMVFQPRIPL